MTTGTRSPTGRPAAEEQTGTTRHGLRRWVAAVVAATMVAALLAATAAGFRFVQSDPLPASPGSPVIAAAYADGPWPAAQVVGTLRLRAGCLLVGDAVAVFPAGTTWSEPDRVVFADGSGWTVGERVEGGGGHLGAEAVTGTDLGDRPTATAAACADDLGADSVVLVRP